MRRFLVSILTVLVLSAACTAAPAATPTPATIGGGTSESAAPTAAVATAEATAAAPATAEATAAVPASETPTTAAPAATLAPADTATRAPTAVPTPAPRPTATAAPAAPANNVGLQLLAEGLTAPVAIVAAPDDTGRLFVVDQVGLVRVIGGDGKLVPTPFLDVRGRMVGLSASYDERGLLGLAFHPDFAHNGRFYVYYSAPLRPGGPAGWDNTIRLSEFKVSANNPNQADAGSERILLQIDEPQANHEGGTIAFGPDGYLYLGPGDGGGANDSGPGHGQGGNGQNTGVLLAKILRIDVNSGDPYGIPADNPFASGGGAPEVFAYGFRNPYRFSFDRGGNHALFVADVGQNLYEEIDIVTKGGNYGWNLREGLHCFSADNPSNPPATCATTGVRGEPLLNPIVEQDHGIGIAIVGGYVYRGAALPGLAGQYVFGQWARRFDVPSGRLFAATAPAGGQGAWAARELSVAGGQLGHFLLGFGQDASGELYLGTSDTSGPRGQTGKVFKIVAP